MLDILDFIEVILICKIYVMILKKEYRYLEISK